MNSPLTNKISEDNFIRQYRRLENLEREKEIKFFSCLGDPAISEFQINKIQNHREENEVKQSFF